MKLSEKIMKASSETIDFLRTYSLFIKKKCKRTAAKTAAKLLQMDSVYKKKQNKNPGRLYLTEIIKNKMK